ncbi:hypothetical protein EP7_003425 [Isosphaeraceae bacterium EP7]
MNSDEFVMKLSASSPSIESLREVGLNTKEAEAFRAGFICLPRNNALPLIASNEILELANRWDVSRVEVGMVRLLGTPTHHSSGIQIGLVEADPLVITKTGSELVVEEVESAGHILWKTARSPGKFLDALGVAAKFFSDRTIGIIDFDDLEAVKATANKCATLAGGDEYAEFYSMLLGVE